MSWHPRSARLARVLAAVALAALVVPPAALATPDPSTCAGNRASTYTAPVPEGLRVAGLFEDVSFHLRRGDRMAIVGANGSGKTTLLRIISGQQQPGAGTVRLGTNVETASIEQALEQQLDFSQTPLEICGTSTMARTLLGCLRVPAACLNRPLRTLSGGERTKVAMARILNSSANLLLLDEPTNHLEIEAQEALEQALRLYPGTVIAVSHDRAFLDALGENATVLQLPAR